MKVRQGKMGDAPTDEELITAFIQGRMTIKEIDSATEYGNWFSFGMLYDDRDSTCILARKLWKELGPKVLRGYSPDDDPDELPENLGLLVESFGWPTTEGETS